MNKIEMRKRPQNSTCECQTYYVSWLWHITCMYRIPAPLSILIYFGGKCPRIEAFQSDKYLHTPHWLLSFPFWSEALFLLCLLNLQKGSFPEVTLRRTSCSIQVTFFDPYSNRDLFAKATRPSLMAENTFLRLHNITSLGPILEGTKGKRGLRAIVYNSDGGGRRHLSGIKACCSVKAVAKDRLPPTYYYPVLLHAPKPSLEMSASVRPCSGLLFLYKRGDETSWLLYNRTYTQNTITHKCFHTLIVVTLSLKGVGRVRGVSVVAPISVSRSQQEAERLSRTKKTK